MIFVVDIDILYSITCLRLINEIYDNLRGTYYKFW